MRWSHWVPVRPQPRPPSARCGWVCAPPALQCPAPAPAMCAARPSRGRPPNARSMMTVAVCFSRGCTTIGGRYWSGMPPSLENARAGGASPPRCCRCCLAGATGPRGIAPMRSALPQRRVRCGRAARALCMPEQNDQEVISTWLQLSACADWPRNSRRASTGRDCVRRFVLSLASWRRRRRVTGASAVHGPHGGTLCSFSTSLARSLLAPTSAVAHPLLACPAVPCRAVPGRAVLCR